MLKSIFTERKRFLAIFLVVAVVSYFLVRRFIFPSTDGFEESTVQKGTVTEELIISGEVFAEEDAKMSFPTSGKIIWVGVSEGDTVKKGQALMKLDTTSLNSTLQRARADLRAAEANVEEVHDDVKNHSGDETFAQKNDRTAAETAKDKAYEAVIIAENNLRDTTLIAPFTGVVTSLANPFSGVNVLATQTQIEVVNPETVHFRVDADQNDVFKIKAGDHVNVTFDAMPDKAMPGIVSFISYSPDEGEIGAVYSVRIDFTDLENSDLTYRVGMTGDASFLLDKKDDALWVPPTFIKSEDGKKYLLTERGKKKVFVEVGLDGEERTEVISPDIFEGMKIYDK